MATSILTAASGAALRIIPGAQVSSRGAGRRAAVELRDTSMESKTEKEEHGTAVGPNLPEPESSRGRGIVDAATRIEKARRYAEAVLGTARASDLAVRNGSRSAGSRPAALLTRRASLSMATPVMACGNAAIRRSSGRRFAVMSTRTTRRGSAMTASGLAALKIIEAEREVKKEEGLIEFTDEEQR